MEPVALKLQILLFYLNFTLLYNSNMGKCQIIYSLNCIQYHTSAYSFTWACLILQRADVDNYFQAKFAYGAYISTMLLNIVLNYTKKET